MDKSESNDQVIQKKMEQQPLPGPSSSVSPQFLSQDNNLSPDQNSNKAGFNMEAVDHADITHSHGKPSAVVTSSETTNPVHPTSYQEWDVDSLRNSSILPQNLPVKRKVNLEIRELEVSLCILPS